ncbi:glycoside hydrolase family 54 protein [Zasmidium cellare ATCC 36951]|uniref:Alpha-L-arabinofuranosidase n=1 Tax=Zasmidium cellare ATCC 36951 TaxID=1080233 RepID=A0A6A6C536_ZASCE|nr:glycoside hydrolase family 54 protein [Zasmidium cellare ATCC 36951]KAF2162033.1 glycoside hydrolase family 54 protein [Zasmidium cellare ATCC 36951]
MSLQLLISVIAIAAPIVRAGPCDLYSSGQTPCVAAHSTTRALYSNYAGPLYQVQRHGNGKTHDIDPVANGGIANSTDQDSFCDGDECVITIIYDQSGHSNHLSHAPPGGNGYGDGGDGYDLQANATAAPIKIQGQKVYGVYIAPGMGYRNDQTNGVATGDQPEGMYAVLDGTHYNDGCCFDYGNAETSNDDTGNGHMEAIYFGTSTGWGSGAGSGPWIMADLENGVFSGQEIAQYQTDPSIDSRFVTAIVKGEANHWALRGGDPTSGSLSTYYSGPRSADGYNPMSKEGAIILGIGGDNSLGAEGTFYEGVMTSGYPTDETENAVQADIKGAEYSV